MKNKIRILLCLAAVVAVQTAAAQTAEHRYRYAAFTEVLDSVEQNNAELKALRELAYAKALDVRSVNNLDDPEVEFSHMWAKNNAKEGEVSIKQGFDFPSAYAARCTSAKLQTEQAQQEYLTRRKQVLVEAQSLCVELVALRMQNWYLRTAFDDAKKVQEMTQKRLDAGDANILEMNNAKYQFIAANNAYMQNELQMESVQTKLDNLNGGKSLTLAKDNYDYFVELPLFEDVLAYWEECAPELKVAELERRIAEQAVKVSRREALPKISLGYKHAFASGGDRANGVVAGISIPIFKSRNTVKLARAEHMVAESQLASAKIDLRADLKTQYDQAQRMRYILSEYTDVIYTDNAPQLLYKALASGQISLVEYYSQLTPVYENFNTYLEYYREYMTLCAQLLMAD